MTDLDNLWIAFEHDPFGQTEGVPNALALADCLEESGRLALAGAVRWMRKTGRCPFRLDRPSGCHWYDRRRRERSGIHPESDLPGEIYLGLTAGVEHMGMFRAYDTLHDAVSDLADALESSRVKPPREEV